MARVAVGLTGASGAIYAIRLLHALEGVAGVDIVDLVVSRHARVALREELDIPLEGPLDLARLIGREAKRTRLHPPDAVESAMASGSNPSLGMVVIPCSMGTLAKIAHGTSDSLLTRAADVCLKERRPLILAVRETPLNLIHLRNMVIAAEAGATLMPAMPAFYGRPQTIVEMVDHFVGRVLSHLGLEHELGVRWRPAQEPGA